MINPKSIVLSQFHLGFVHPEGEDYVKDITNIGEAALRIMTCEIIDGEKSQKLSKGEKRGMEQQRQNAPMNIEDFGCEIQINN